MTVAANAFVLLSILFAVLAGPTVAFIVFRRNPTSWPSILKDHQTLAGSLVTLFTAGVAVTGVLINASIQTSNVDKQLQAQQNQLKAANTQLERKAAYDEAVHRRQVASAFLAEITLIRDAFAGASWREKAEALLAKLDAANKSPSVAAAVVQVVVAQPPPDLAVYFRSNTQEIGRLPMPFPRKVLEFYGIYAVLQDTLAKMNSASRENFAHMDAPNVKVALETELKQLVALQEMAAELVPNLQKVIDAELPPLD